MNINDRKIDLYSITEAVRDKIISRLQLEDTKVLTHPVDDVNNLLHTYLSLTDRIDWLEEKEKENENEDNN